jgi:hypothetical protein
MQLLNFEEQYDWIPNQQKTKKKVVLTYFR